VITPYFYLLTPAPTTATATAITATAAIFDTCATRYLYICSCAATPSYCDW
jgi:hypothetical protein